MKRLAVWLVDLIARPVGRALEVDFTFPDELIYDPVAGVCNGDGEAFCVCPVEGDE